MNLITIWGSSGGGKTSVALAIAATLANEREDVLVISNDSRTPALPVYLPNCTTLAASNSLGGVLEQNVVTEAALKDRIHRHTKSDRLFFMGYISGEVAGISYKVPQREVIAGLLQQLRQSPFKHVIIDADANPIYDPLTLWGLEHSDHVVRVVTPDIKGYEWQKAQLTWLGHSELFHAERHIKVANFISDTSPLTAAQCVFGAFDFELPATVQVRDKMAAGELLSKFNSPTGVKYERQITSLVARLKEKEEEANE